LLLHATRHFFEFIQAGVRDRYHEPASVQARSHQLAQAARQTWSKLQTVQVHGPAQILDYLESISLAANAVAMLAGAPLAERRILLQFPARARAAGQPDLAAAILNLLGANSVDGTTLTGFLPEWEKTFLEAASRPDVDKRIAAARLGYYKLAFEATLTGELPQAMLWPMLLTWTLAVSVLPPLWELRWRSACGLLGLDEASFRLRLVGLDHFLDSVEAIIEKLNINQGL
jgi:hypothetical protein